MIFLRNSTCLELQPSYRNNDMMFWILPIVLCDTFSMWHWPICESLDLRFIWGHHRLHYFSEWLVNQPITSHIFLLHNAGETQECRNSCPWPQFLAFCLRSKYIVIILLGFLGSNQCWIIVKDKKNNNTKFQLDQDRGSLLKSSLTDSMFLPVGISIALSSPNVLTLSRKERCRRRGPKPTTIACIKHNNFSSIIAVNVPSSC